MSHKPHCERRPLASTGMSVSPVALGCWPIAGVSTLDTNEADSIATIRACFDLGINHLDTAHVYGPHGESENLIRRALAGSRRGASRRDEMVIATKCGIHYEGDEMVTDGRPERLIAECNESLRRLGTDRVELLYLHAPDPNVPIADSAGALRELLTTGKTRSVGASNFTVEQLDEFVAICPIAAVQLPYNMLQRDIEQRSIPWCRAHNVAVMIYWPLMKGLLAGRLPKDQPLDERDKRRNFPTFQGDQWQKNQEFVDRLREAAALSPLPPEFKGALSPLPPGEGQGEGLLPGVPGAKAAADAPDHAARRDHPTRFPTVAQLVINWTIHQPGITTALCGAKRPWQIEETAGAMGWQLTQQQRAMIDAAIKARGQAVTKRPFS